MPSDDPASLGSQLASLLLRTGVCVLLGALLAGVGWWAWARRAAPATEPIETTEQPEQREPNARRFLRIAFGLLWIVDGLLQAQPLMPAGFVSDDITPQVQAGPPWYAALMAPLTRAWTRHPVVADVAVIWLQIGLGLLILIAVRGLLSTLVAWAAIAVSAGIWVLGEGFGGLLSAGAGWLTGSPGAVLAYAGAAGLLLAPWRWWERGIAQTVARRGVAVWFLVGAVLQALPAEQFWTGAGLAAPFADGAATFQPQVFRTPLSALSRLAERSPQALNLSIVLLVAAVGVWVWLDGRTAAVSSGLVLCAATWWLAQDFGVLGGTATDPNTALPLALVLAAALPAWSARRTVPAPELRRVPGGVRAGLVALAAGLAFVVPVVLATVTVRPADAAAVAADSHGGLRSIPSRPAPTFSLVDQNRHRVSTATLRGKLVVLTFLDAVCTSDCPLIANQLAIADRGLGRLARRVEFVAIDSNPVFHTVPDVTAFTRSHGLATLANWHFLCGPATTTQDVLAQYGISVDVPTVGMIQHSEGLFFITPDGDEAAYLDDRAGSALTWTYAQQVQDQIRALLK